MFSRRVGAIRTDVVDELREKVQRLTTLVAELEEQLTRTRDAYRAMESYSLDREDLYTRTTLSDTQRILDLSNEARTLRELNASLSEQLQTALAGDHTSDDTALDT
jgi:predicted nuclease with TOPRIM domain